MLPNVFPLGRKLKSDSFPSGRGRCTFSPTLRNNTPPHPPASHPRPWLPIKRNYKPIQFAVERNVLQVPTKHDPIGRPLLLMFFPCVSHSFYSDYLCLFLFRILFFFISLRRAMRACVICGVISRTGTFSIYTSVTFICTRSESHFFTTQGGETITGYSLHLIEPTSKIF